MVSTYNGLLRDLARKEILTPATAGMNLEDIMLREKAGHKRTKSI